MVTRRLSISLDHALALVGIVRPGPANRPAPPAPESPEAQRQIARMQRSVDRLGRQIGFEVGPDGFWRYGELVVVSAAKPAAASGANDLPHRIDVRRSAARISPSDAVTGLYVCAEDTPAVAERSSTDHEARAAVVAGYDYLGAWG